MKYSVPEGGVLKTFHTCMTYEWKLIILHIRVIVEASDHDLISIIDFYTFGCTESHAGQWDTPAAIENLALEAFGNCGPPSSRLIDTYMREA